MASKGGVRRRWGRENNQTPSDLMCPAVGTCMSPICACVCVRVYMCLVCRRAGVQMSARYTEPRQNLCVSVCVCHCMFKYVAARVSQP